MFAIASMLILLSRAWLLGSTGGASRLIEYNRLPVPGSSEEAFSVAEKANTVPRPRPKDNVCDPRHAVLKVFMYDLPPEFHFGLLNWKPKPGSNSTWPDITREIPRYPGGLKQQHSIEYWLTLDLLSSSLPNRPGPCAAIRVVDSREADVVFVPFFSSLSLNLYTKAKPDKDKILQEKLVKFLTKQEEWKRSGGRDHVIMAHHPNSMLDARFKLFPSMFILSDLGRYAPNIANVEKDVIAPYKHMITTFVNDSAGFDDRPTLLYFQGAIYRKDVSFLAFLIFIAYI